MKVALVHDYLTEIGGANKVLEIFKEIFPDAPVYTLLYNPETTDPKYAHWHIVTSSLQNSFFSKLPQFLRPLSPQAIESFDFSEFDLVISSSNSFAHGILTPAKTTHVCYYHAPMRYAWDYYFDYIKDHKLYGLKGLLAKKAIHKLRIWDFAASFRPDFTIANSDTTAARVQHFYKRDVNAVIYPPVDTNRFYANNSHADYFFIVSRLSPYKKVDLAIEACNKLKQSLVVVGNGPELKRLQSLAGPTVEILGPKQDNVIEEYMENCKAFIFPASDDFGITAVEAMAAGKPVIAFDFGGAKETVINNKTGILFPEQNVEFLSEAIKKLNDSYDTFDSVSIHRYAQKFSKEAFKNNFIDFLHKHVGITI